MVGARTILPRDAKKRAISTRCLACWNAKQIFEIPRLCAPSGGEIARARSDGREDVSPEETRPAEAPHSRKGL